MPARMASASGSGSGPVMSARVASEGTIPLVSYAASHASRSPLCAKRSMISMLALRASRERAGPDIAQAAAATVFGVLPARRAAWAAVSSGLPCRQTSEPTAMSTRASSVGVALRPNRASTTLASSEWRAAVSTETPRRCDTWVLGSMKETAEASFMAWRGGTEPICSSRDLICSS